MADDRKCRCTRGPCSPCKNDVPGARSWETPEQTEERKWIAWLMRRYPRLLTSTERLILEHLYATLDGERRLTCDEIVVEVNVTTPERVHEVEAEALKKLGYDHGDGKPRRRRTG